MSTVIEKRRKERETKKKAQFSSKESGREVSRPALTFNSIY